jgi:hypothetical protein
LLFSDSKTAAKLTQKAVKITAAASFSCASCDLPRCGDGISAFETNIVFD